MRVRARHAIVLVGTLMLTAGCATSEQWKEWRGHSSHFASGHHLVFSVQNREGAAPRVTQRDLDTSRSESWWGQVIIVSSEQIFKE
ncbi:MAG: hypothetical protein ACE5JD_10935 [Candidatus Methylomirabilia bacterium]